MKHDKLQSAIDFMIAYSIALAIIIAVIAIIMKINILGVNIAPQSCTSAPLFSCGDILYSSNGILTFSFSQAIGGAINITAVACSSAINATNYAPQYGNIYLLGYNQAHQYYPNNMLSNGIIMYSDSSATIQVYCYDGSNIETEAPGSTVTDYVWINYTSTALPKNYYTIEKVLQFSTKVS
ncbi:MAG: hypothetical protein ACP5UN_00140 [Candidatus Micrarchaeia archaeon]